MAHHGLISDDPTFKSRKRTTGEVLRRVWAYLLPYKGLALATVGCAVLSLLCALTYPKLTEYIIDGIIEKDGGTTSWGSESHEATSPIPSRMPKGSNHDIQTEIRPHANRME